MHSENMIVLYKEIDTALIQLFGFFFSERITEQQLHINGYRVYLYNRGSGHIPQVADQ